MPSPSRTPRVDPAAYADGLVPAGPGVWRCAGAAPGAAAPFPADEHRLYADVEDTSFWFRHRRAAILAVVERRRPPGPLFDLGGGTGHVAAGLLAAGWPAVVVEPGDAGVAAARRRGAPAIHAAVEDVAFRPGALPAAGLFDVLEHLPDDAGLLSRIRGWLLPGGRIYLTAPASPSLWSPEDERLGHHRRYTRAGLLALLGRAGFEVEHATHLFAPLVAPVFLLRAVPGRLGLRREVPAAVRKAELTGGGLAPLLAPALACERAAIRAGRSIPLGTSLLMVARAP